MLRKHLKLYYFTFLYILPVYIKLKKFNIKKVSFFNFFNWHNGYCYFKGIYLEKEVFIKVDTKLHLLINDKLSYDLCKDIMRDDLVNILHYSMDGKIQFVAYDFIDSKELDENILLDNIHYLDDIIRILSNLSQLDIIHRDIKLDNFLVYNNTLKIIDFTFANSNTHKDFKEVNVENSFNCFLLEFLGAGLNPTPFVWDDYYSFYTILKKLKQEENNFCNVKLSTCIKEIEKFIGQTVYRIKCGTKYYFFIRRLKIRIKEIIGMDHKYRMLS